ncbi:deoxymugineic acid synthase 1-D-like [Oryza glaberrima]|uniref:NADP-dependent oxidoreductase domain-containing protein n=2 Tax=Oryza TaxID=4527 RepID=A0A0D3HAK2_9ORYZ|nr:deoxymugineic acid synthase 1-D-like [Oryza glaberrima]
MAGGGVGASAAAAATIPEAALRSGKPMPLVGMGTASFPLDASQLPATVRDAVLRAIDAGYRHFDTAAAYGTEAPLGEAVLEAVRAGMVASRDDLYITSKLWISDTHPGRVLPALRRTLRNLQMVYIDLYLIHWPIRLRVEQETPSPVYDNDFVMMDMEGVWKDMEECQRLGLTKAIGVSNFTCKKLNTLLSFATIPPAANQVEINPYCRQNKLREFCKEKEIQLCAYSPLGASGTIWGSNAVLDCPVLKHIAVQKGKTVAQVCLRWLHEQGDCIIVKSFNERRMRENLEIFDWELTDADRQEISALPEFRGNRDFYVHESGPYKTTDEFWDGEITGPQLKTC